MSTVHLHAARHVMSRWYLAIWPPILAVAALLLPDLPWRPGALILFDVALFPLASWLALAGGPDEDRLWRAVGSPAQAALGRVLAHLILLAPAALILDGILGSELGFTPGAYAASVLFTYGAVRAGAAIGRVWASVGMVLALGGLIFDAWLQIRGGTYAGVLDLRRGFLTLGLGGTALGALWEARLGAWGVGVKRGGRAALLLGPTAALLLVPPFVDRAMGPVRLYSAGLPALSPDGARALRLAVSDGHLFPAVQTAWLWEGGVERRIGAFDVEGVGLGPGGALYLFTKQGDRAIVTVQRGEERWRCALAPGEIFATLSWRADGAAAVLYSLGDTDVGFGARYRSFDASGCAELPSDYADYQGMYRVELRDGAVVWGDQSRAVPQEGAPYVVDGVAFLYVVQSAGDRLYRLEPAGPRLLMVGEELQIETGEGVLCASDTVGAWICFGADGAATASERPRTLWREGHLITDVDGASWTLPEDLDVGPAAPMVRLAPDTLRVASWDAIWDLRRDGTHTRHPLTGAPEPQAPRSR